MRKWDREVLNINETVSWLDDKCKVILAMPALSGSDCTSYLCGKGKISAYNTFMDDSFPDLSKLGEEQTSHEQVGSLSCPFMDKIMQSVPTMLDTSCSKEKVLPC